MATNGKPVKGFGLKHSATGTTIFTVMSALATQHNAINLSQGFPDGDPPAALVQAAKDAMDAGRHQYAVTWGAPELRDALAAKLTRCTGLPVDPLSELVVTCGATEAMLAAVMTVCDPGDRIGMFSPFYENYAADAILSGAEPVYVSLTPPDFNFDRDELRRAFAQKSYDLFLKEWTEKGHVHENYNAILGTGDDVASSDRFYHWGALLGYLQYLEQAGMKHE